MDVTRNPGADYFRSADVICPFVTDDNHQSASTLQPRHITSPAGLNSLVVACPTRSTQPCTPLGSLNRVPASAVVKAWMSVLPGGT